MVLQVNHKHRVYYSTHLCGLRRYMCLEELVLFFRVILFMPEEWFYFVTFSVHGSVGSGSPCAEEDVLLLRTFGRKTFTRRYGVVKRIRHLRRQVKCLEERPEDAFLYLRILVPGEAELGDGSPWTFLRALDALGEERNLSSEDDVFKFVDKTKEIDEVLQEKQRTFWVRFFRYIGSERPWVWESSVRGQAIHFKY